MVKWVLRLMLVVIVSIAIALTMLDTTLTTQARILLVVLGFGGIVTSALLMDHPHSPWVCRYVVGPGLLLFLAWYALMGVVAMEYVSLKGQRARFEPSFRATLQRSEEEYQAFLRRSERMDSKNAATTAMNLLYKAPL